MVTVREVVHEISRSRRGVRPSFGPPHVVKALLLLEDKEPLGRLTLSKHLGLGVASVRTLISRLRAFQLVEVDIVAGCRLTARGKALVSAMRGIVSGVSNVTEVVGEDLKLDRYAYGALLRSAATKVLALGVTTIRDAVVRHGASAALVALVGEDAVYVPPERGVTSARYPSLAKLSKHLRAQPNDVIVVAYADDASRAEVSLYGALLELFLDIPVG